MEMLLAVLVGITEWWSSYYGNHQLASVSIRFLHLAGIVMGAGTGLFADRQILGAVRAKMQEREAVLAAVNREHAHVVSWIIVIGTTGVLMTAADTSTFMVSKLYWIKMAMVGLLIANGIALLLAEQRARKIGVDAGWPRLIAVSTISAILWLTILFLGTLLTVAA
jgi:hypothetical protein